jgi:outer membrane murein-binding lipoprotein Lpp
MISAFKHIRLSGQNLIPILDSSTNTLRLSLGNTGLAYYPELTGLSGYLRGLIQTADDDVTRINNLSGAVTFQGGQGIGIGVDPLTNTITISGADSGYFQGLVNTLTTNLESTGSTLNTKINTLSGYVNDQDTAISNNLASTGSTLNIKVDNLSGFVTGTFVRKLNQQVFNSDIPVGVESTGILFPLAFSSTPSTVNVTLETAGDVMYMVGVRGRSATGYFADFSDIVLESTVKLNTFASNQ